MSNEVEGYVMWVSSSKSAAASSAQALIACATFEGGVHKWEVKSKQIMSHRGHGNFYPYVAKSRKNGQNHRF